MNIEKEIKLNLNEHEFIKLRESLIKVCESKNSITQTNYYFDTYDLSLYRNDETVRLRNTGNSTFEIAVKGKFTDSLSSIYKVRKEKKCEIRQSKFYNILNKKVMERSEFNILEELISLESNNQLIYFGSLRTERTVFILGNNKIVLDKNYYLNTCDYELEIETDNFEKSISFIKELFTKNDLIFRGESSSKFNRFIHAYAER